MLKFNNVVKNISILTAVMLSVIFLDVFLTWNKILIGAVIIAAVAMIAILLVSLFSIDESVSEKSAADQDTDPTQETKHETFQSAIQDFDAAIAACYCKHCEKEHKRYDRAILVKSVCSTCQYLGKK